jgi:hypothetical protein
MEDILASIRRILAEEEGIPPAAPVATPPAAASDIADGVLQLEASMMLPDAVAAPAPPLPEVPPAPPLPEVPPAPAREPPLPPEIVTPPPPSASLMAPEAAAATATLVGSLVRTLTAERTMQVHSGGPTIEDVVRTEVRPLLKQWLDANLPDMVERLVRTEIERVVGRAVP